MKRPTSVTVFGILNIVFAAFGILSVFGSVMLFAATSATSNNPVIRIIHNNPAYAAWLEVSIGLGLIVSGALLAAGIGLLQLKPWARIISIVYSIYSLVMVPVGTAISYVYVTQPLLAQAHTSQNQEAAAIGGTIGGMIGGCFGLIYPVLLLIFMLLPKVASAFRPENQAVEGQQ
jgi:hypothetical protein